MAPRPGAIAIVDPYGSGRFLLDELRQRGWPCVAVRSTLSISPSLLATWNAVPFDRVVVHRGDLAKTAGELRANDPPIRAVAAGCDLGAGLADALAEELGLPGNGTELSTCRADRCLVQERLREHGLRACRQTRASSAAEAVAFAQEVGHWPLVAKSCSASSQGASTFRCDDEEALAGAADLVLKAASGGGFAAEVLVQEAVVGIEHIVDCVSLEGRHLVMGLWSCERTCTDSGVCSDRTKTVPYDDADCSQRALREYVCSCLTSLGLRYGASTCNVIVDESGPCLVDMAQRMQNGVGPVLWTKCAGRERGQAYLWADVLTEDGQEVTKCLDAVATGGPAYVLSSFSLQLDLQCPEEGVLERSIEDVAGKWIRALPSFWKSKFFVEEADRVKATCDMLTSPGYVILVGKDAAEVERDAAEIRRAEKEGGVYAMRCASSMTKTASLPSPKNAVASKDGGRRQTLPVKLQASGKVREMELQMEAMLSPLVSRAASPQLSPQCAPKFAPSAAASGLEDFSLGDAEEDDDLEFDLGEAVDGDGEPPEFSLDGLSPSHLTPSHGDGRSPLLGFSIGGPAAAPLGPR